MHVWCACCTRGSTALRTLTLHTHTRTLQLDEILTYKTAAKKEKAAVEKSLKNTSGMILTSPEILALTAKREELKARIVTDKAEAAATRAEKAAEKKVEKADKKVKNLEKKAKSAAKKEEENAAKEERKLAKLAAAAPPSPRPRPRRRPHPHAALHPSPRVPRRPHLHRHVLVRAGNARSRGGSRTTSKHPQHLDLCEERVCGCSAL